MTTSLDTRGLQPGDELQCPHCAEWHRVLDLKVGSTLSRVRPLYYRCGRGLFYAGARGEASPRVVTRASSDPVTTPPAAA